MQSRSYSRACQLATCVSLGSLIIVTVLMLEACMTCVLSLQAESSDSARQSADAAADADVDASLLDGSGSALASASACLIPPPVCLQVCACIRTAMDAAQDAAAARDKLLDQQAESEAELWALRAKTTRQAAAVAAAADAEERVTAAEAKCKAAHADTSSWQSQVWQMRAAILAEPPNAPSITFCLWYTVELIVGSDLARVLPAFLCLILRGVGLFTQP